MPVPSTAQPSLRQQEARAKLVSLNGCSDRCRNAARKCQIGGDFAAKRPDARGPKLRGVGGSARSAATARGGAGRHEKDRRRTIAAVGGKAASVKVTPSTRARRRHSGKPMPVAMIAARAPPLSRHPWRCRAPAAGVPARRAGPRPNCGATSPIGWRRASGRAHSSTALRLRPLRRPRGQAHAPVHARGSLDRAAGTAGGDKHRGPAVVGPLRRRLHRPSSMPPAPGAPWLGWS